MIPRKRSGEGVVSWSRRDGPESGSSVEVAAAGADLVLVTPGSAKSSLCDSMYSRAAFLRSLWYVFWPSMHERSMMPVREPSQRTVLRASIESSPSTRRLTLEHTIDLLEMEGSVQLLSDKEHREQLTLVQATSVVTLTWQPPCALQVKTLLVLTEKSLPLGTSGVRVVVSLAMQVSGSTFSFSSAIRHFVCLGPVKCNGGEHASCQNADGGLTNPWKN